MEFTTKDLSVFVNNSYGKMFIKFCPPPSKFSENFEGGLGQV